MEVISRPEPYDAIVVGSGATGGVAAWRLTGAGLRVLVLEAGPTLKGGRSSYGTQGTNMAKQVFRHFVTGRQKVQETRPFSSGELVMKKVVEEKFGRHLIISRGIRARRHADKGEKFTRLSSPGTTLAAANATGRLTLQTDAVVSRVIVDPKTGLAS